MVFENDHWIETIIKAIDDKKRDVERNQTDSF